MMMERYRPSSYIKDFTAWVCIGSYSGDGTLAVYDPRKQATVQMSSNMEEGLTCLALMKVTIELLDIACYNNMHHIIQRN